MQRKIDIGEDKNLFDVDAKSATRPTMTFLMDDMPKTSDEAVQEARKTAWINWVNSEPLVHAYTDEKGASYLFFISELLKNKVVLLFVWDYTLLPSRRALSYVLEWHKRYGGAGLVTIGIHSPMFEFGRDKKNILDACRDLGVMFPVVLDNDFNIWKSLENRYWPRMLLLDPATRSQRDLVGEGSYVELEKTIQVLLRELSPGLACPPVLKPMRAIDRDDYAVPATSPEIFFGLRWKPRLGNVATFTDQTEVTFVDESNGNYAPDLPYLSGRWVAGHEGIYALSTKSGNKLTVKFQGTDAYIVARSRPRNPADIPQMTKVQIELDGRVPFEENIGSDAMLNEYRRCVVQAREPRLYHVATRLEHKQHALTISIEEEGSDTLELFAIFFEHRA